MPLAQGWCWVLGGFERRILCPNLSRRLACKPRRIRSPRQELHGAIVYGLTTHKLNQQATAEPANKGIARPLDVALGSLQAFISKGVQNRILGVDAGIAQGPNIAVSAMPFPVCVLSLNDISTSFFHEIGQRHP